MDKYCMLNDISALGERINAVCSDIPDSRAKSIAITHLETGVMWLYNAIISVNSENNQGIIDQLIDELRKM